MDDTPEEPTPEAAWCDAMVGHLSDATMDRLALCFTLNDGECWALVKSIAPGEAAEILERFGPPPWEPRA